MRRVLRTTTREIILVLHKKGYIYLYIYKISGDHDFRYIVILLHRDSGQFAIFRVAVRSIWSTVEITSIGPTQNERSITGAYFLRIYTQRAFLCLMSRIERDSSVSAYRRTSQSVRPSCHLAVSRRYCFDLDYKTSSRSSHGVDRFPSHLAIVLHNDSWCNAATGGPRP